VNGIVESRAQAGAYRRTIYVGGRGYGKTQRMREAQARYKLSPEDIASWVKSALDIELAPWQQEFIKGRVHGHWDYTPADELLHRLNQRLQGKDPGLPINTRFWRDQK
jgi:hypothetical protein